MLSEFKLLTTQDVAGILRCSEKTVYNRVKSGDLLPTYNGRLVRFTEQSVREFLERNRTPNTQQMEVRQLKQELT